MPTVSVDYLHELVFGCIRTIESAASGVSGPSRHTRTWRLRRNRMRKHDAWLMVRMNSAGWDELGDRWKFCGDQTIADATIYTFSGARPLPSLFSEVPDDLALLIVDKRQEVEIFDVEQGYRSIGVTFTSHPSTE